MNTRTIPGKSKHAFSRLGQAAGNTIGTAVMDFDAVSSLLSDLPLRRPVHVRMEDIELQDDLDAAKAALSESDEFVPYAEVRKEFGLGD
jgi:hypothetical protein